LFIPFDGYCPKCGGGCDENDLEYHGGFIVAELVCVECKHELRVSYDNGKILKGK